MNIYFDDGFSIKGIVGQESLVDNTFCHSADGTRNPPIALYHEAVENCYFTTRVDAQNNTLVYIIPTATTFKFKLGQNATFIHENYAKPSITANNINISDLMEMLNESASDIAGLCTSSKLNPLSKIKPDPNAPYSLGDFVGYCHDVTVRDNLTSGLVCLRYKSDVSHPFTDSTIYSAGEDFFVKVISNPIFTSIDVINTSYCEVASISGNTIRILSYGVVPGQTVQYTIRVHFSDGSTSQYTEVLTAISEPISFKHSVHRWVSGSPGHWVSDYLEYTGGAPSSWQWEFRVDSDEMLMTVDCEWSSYHSEVTKPDSRMYLDFTARTNEGSVIDLNVGIEGNPAGSDIVGRIIYPDGVTGRCEWNTVIVINYHDTQYEYIIPCVMDGYFEGY